MRLFVVYMFALLQGPIWGLEASIAPYIDFYNDNLSNVDEFFSIQEFQEFHPDLEQYDDQVLNEVLSQGLPKF